MTEKTEYAVYPVAMERAKAYILPGDIPDIAELFEKDYGYCPQKLFINPKMAKYIKVDKPEIIEHHGVATWEIWAELKTPNTLINATLDGEPVKLEFINSPNQNLGVSLIDTSILTPKRIMKRRIKPLPPLSAPVKSGGRGRPLKAGEVSRVTDWRRRKKLQGKLL